MHRFEIWVSGLNSCWWHRWLTARLAILHETKRASKASRKVWIDYSTSGCEYFTLEHLDQCTDAFLRISSGW